MPRNVTIVSETPNSVVFKADAPKSDGGKPVTEWKLAYGKEEDHGHNEMELVLKNGKKNGQRMPSSVQVWSFLIYLILHRDFKTFQRIFPDDVAVSISVFY